MAYRHWCGECSYKTAWLSESQSEEQQIQHYAKQHPGVPRAAAWRSTRAIRAAASDVCRCWESWSFC